MSIHASSPTEAEVVLAATGDREAFARLVTVTRSLVSSIALAELRDVEAARDVAQDVYLQVWNDLGALRNPRSFLPFLRQVARQRARRVAERRAREVRGPGAARSLEAAVDPAEDASGRLVRTERFALVREALDALPDDAREIVALYYLEGHSGAQVARLLGLREEAVHQRLSRARARLRADLLERLGDALGEAAPGAAFTAAVLAALPSGAYAAGAGTGLAAATSAGAGKATVVGGIVAALAILVVLATSSGGGGSGTPGGAGGTVSIARPRPPATREEPSTLPEVVPGEGGLDVRVTAAGAPVAGAEVRVYRRVAMDPVSGTPGWQVVRSLETGQDGRARVPATPGAYLVAARAPRYAPGQGEVVRPSGEPATYVEITLGEGSVLSGRVVARTSGEPVPLAVISLERESTLGLPVATFPLEERFGATADGSGRFSVRGLAAGRYQLVAEAPGHARTTLRQVTVPRRAPLEVQLGDAGVIEGRVVLADGHPAPGAEVRFSGGPELLVVTAGSQGGFAAEVEPGSYWISATREGATGAIGQPVAVAAGGTARGIDIRLGPSASVAGRVIGVGGSPVAGAQVRLSPATGPGEFSRTLTSSSGAFELGTLAPGEYDLDLVADGHSPAARRGLVLLSGQRFVIELQLEGVGSVEGTVRDESGAPLPGARIRGGKMWGGAAGSVPAEAITGSDGRYLLPALEVGVADVRAHRPGALLGESRTVPVEAGRRASADFVLPLTGTVEGEVRFAAPPRGEPTILLQVAPDQMMIGSRDVSRIEVSEDGRFRTELPVGSFRLRASTSDGTAATERVPVKITAGETSRVELVLTPVEEDPRRIVVDVREPGGAPAGDAVVVLVGEGYRAMMLADAMGRATLNRPPVPAAVEARKGGRLSRPSPLAPDARSFVVELQPAAMVRGRVVAPGGAPPTGFTLTVETPAPNASFGDGDRRLFTGDRFEIADLPSGPGKLVVTTEDGRAGEASLSLAPGELAERDVTIQAAGRILARPVDERGRSVEGSYVTIGARMIDAAIDGVYHDPKALRGGGIVVDQVPAGKHEIRIGARQYQEVVRTVDVEPGQTVDLGAVRIGTLPLPRK
jgi:RNA polymerase sigma factor (sigma-70 family)